MPDSRKASLADKFDLGLSRQLLNGSQAILRLMLMQRASDKAAGLNTAGYVTGYRGSPIAGLEGTFQRYSSITKANEIVFQPGLNEDLAATAIWGTQQAELRGEGKFDGVFALWYGKGPGVDRSGDVFRHANHAGTSAKGGVLALMGDDHTCESSTSAHQSEFAFVDAMIPVLNPAGVQELIDFGLIGFAMSRYAGVWVGLKCVKDNIESTASVDGRADRVQIVTPDDFTMPPGGLNIRLQDSALAKEARLHDYKRDAIVAFGRANNLDKTVLTGGKAPKIGIITTGKSYLDTRQGLDELGIDEVTSSKLGIRLYKVGMTYPMDPKGFLAFADGLDMIIVVEEKRALIEVQAREELYGNEHQPVLIGKKDERGNVLFPAKGALDPVDIAINIGERLVNAGAGEAIKARLAELKRLKGNAVPGQEAATRIPYFCAGCPHNRSTVLPDGARAYAGIGCHYMVQWMDRNTEGFTHMGGEGANWIGEAPFSKRRHVYQNLGDGTYIHSGSLAIRAAIAAGTNITFKILYNDAVAMTGGQALDGGLTVPQMAAQVMAEGVKAAMIVTDDPEKFASTPGIPSGVGIHHRDDLQSVQTDLSKIDGVTVLIYDQTCAAEKRRRRKRGVYPDPAKRIFINAAVCEGCGDCGVKSNCVAIQPLETELGRKRVIDQSACNKDYSCLNGFCPSFVTVHGAHIRKREKKPTMPAAAVADAIANLPEPVLPSSAKPYTMLVAGVGGTGVVTVSAVLAQAAHIDGKGFGSIDMTGLAQKGGAVACHMRVANDPENIHAIRAGLASANLIIGCDLVVVAAHKVLETIRPDKTAIVFNTHEMVTGAFTHDPSMSIPGGALRSAIQERIGMGPSFAIDAHDLAVRLFGDSIMSNMLLLGYSYQKGLVPISAASIEEAIRLNNVAVDPNLQAFRYGRLGAHDAAALEKLARPPSVTTLTPVKTLDEKIAYRAKRLSDYQDDALAVRYRAKLERIAGLERDKAAGRSGLVEAVAEGYFKLLSYKDEYEIARLFTDGRFEQAVRENFDGELKLEFHLAPPLLARRDKTTGEPRKMRFGSWMLPVFRQLAKGKRLRGTRWDIFGYSAERRAERQMITTYERVLDEIARHLSPQTHGIAVDLARLPLDIKGFGHIKQKNHAAAMERERVLLAELRSPAPSPMRQAAE